MTSKRPNETRGPRRKPDALDRLAAVIASGCVFIGIGFIGKALAMDPEMRLALGLCVALGVVVLAFVRLIDWYESEEQGPGGCDRP